MDHSLTIYVQRIVPYTFAWWQEEFFVLFIFYSSTFGNLFPFVIHVVRVELSTFTVMMSSHGNIFRVTDPLLGEFTGSRWIPLIKASDAEL